MMFINNMAHVRYYILFPFFFLHSFSFFAPSFSDTGFSAFSVGRRVSIPMPPAYEGGFRGRAFYLEGGGKEEPSFRAALSLEAVDGSYACSLKVLLGDAVVWASDHLVKFRPRRTCTVELTREGDLKVLDKSGRVGWRTGTSGQGVKKLQLHKRTGNLILVDAEERVRWQSFDHPTDVMLWGQRLNATARLTSFAPGSAASYTFEIGGGALGLYLNFRDRKYSYWEHRTLSNKTIAYAVLGSGGLKLFDGDSRKIGQILANRGDPTEAAPEPVRFLALGGTGNLDLYYCYHNSTGGTTYRYRSSYRAIGSLCDLPLPCGPNQVCAPSSNGACLALPKDRGDYTGFCDGGSYDGSGRTGMVELDRVDTVLKTTSQRTGLSEEECAGSCAEACSCSAALYCRGTCSHYGIVGGARQVGGGGNECSYWVKVSRDGRCGMSSSLIKKLLLFGEVVDVLAITSILGGLLYYFLRVRKRGESSEPHH